MSSAISKQTDADATRRPLSRQAYEDFLYQEAALLDEWRLDEWFALFEAGATYEVPTAGASDEADSHDSLFYIADDYARLGYRVERLKKTGAHSEFPRSICTRLISNVRVLGTTEQGVVLNCKFVTYRSKDNVTHTFFGHHRYVLANDGDAIRIISKRSHLDMSSLRPQGRVSIIL